MRTTPRRRTALAVLGAALALGTTACGPFSDDAKPAGPFGELTGSQIVDKAFAATKGAKSLTVDIDERKAAEPLKAYVSLDVRGQCAGTLTTDTTNTVELIRPDHKTVYLRFDEASLREQVKGEDAETQKAIIKQLQGHWVKGSASDPDTKDIVGLCDPKQLLGGFEQGASGIVKGAETTVGGRKALALTEPGDGGESSTVYVATEGTPYVLKIVTKGGEEPGTITFSHYGKPVEAKAPAAKDVVKTD